MRSFSYWPVVSSIILGIAGSARLYADVDAKTGFELLIPAPQETQAGTGHIALGSSITLSTPAEWADNVDRYLWLLNDVLAARKATPIVVVKESVDAAIRVRQAQGSQLPASGYELKIGDGAIELTAPDPAGVFNGLATLAQLIELCGNEALEVPIGRIRDWPELPMRAIHIDMGAQKFKASYVQWLMKAVARYKINAIVMEYNDTFPFRKYPAIRRPDAFSEGEVQAFRKTAESCNQEIIPLIQCTYHAEYILTQDPTGMRLSEGHDGAGYCLSLPDVQPFVKSLIDEVLAQHPGAKKLHIGGDEVRPGSCKRCADASSFHARYMKHNAQLAEYILAKGITPLMYTDVFASFDFRTKRNVLDAKIKEALTILPRGIVGVDWWYRSNDFLISPRLREAGVQAITASAARSSIQEGFNLPLVSLHMPNIRAGCLQAVKSKMMGTIITSWSYRGSPHEICLPEYACAAYGWNTREAAVPAFLARFFRQRYAFSEELAASLARAVLSESQLRVPTTATGSLVWNPTERCWMVPPERQAGQRSPDCPGTL